MRGCQPSESSLCSVAEVAMCVTSALEPRCCRHSLMSDSSCPISSFPAQKISLSAFVLPSSALVGLRNPIIVGSCCARSPIGQAAMLPSKPMNSRRLIAAPESRGGILSSKTERVEAAHNVRFGSKADIRSARAHVRYKRTSEGDRTHDRGHDQRYSTSRAIPTRSRHTQAAIDSPVIARRRRDYPVLLSGLGSQELRGVYRLIQITALIAVNADS